MIIDSIMSGNHVLCIIALDFSVLFLFYFRNTILKFKDECTIEAVLEFTFLIEGRASIYRFLRSVCNCLWITSVVCFVILVILFISLYNNDNMKFTNRCETKGF